MNPNRTLLFCLLLSCIIFGSSAQGLSDEGYFLFKGKIINQENEEPLPYITIYNKSRQQGTTSGSKGEFTLGVQSGDSLIFQSMGFEDFHWIVEKAQDAGETIIFKMVPKTYELQNVEISAFRTEEAFKRHLLSMDMPEEKKIEIPGLDMIKFERNPGDAPVVISGPVSFLYNKFSNRVKEHKKYLIAKEHYEKQQMLALKFNKDIVKKIIKVDDPEELDQFMEFCNLQDTFIESANEYDLIVAVNKCYDDFKNQRSNN